MMNENYASLEKEENNYNEEFEQPDNKFEFEIFQNDRTNSKKYVDTGFYDKQYYKKLELIDYILKFIQHNFKRHYPPNENINLNFDVLMQLKELINILNAYFNVLPPMQKKCLDKNINDLINNNILKKSDLTKKIYFIERDIKKAKYNLISKKDLFELLKKRGLE